MLVVMKSSSLCAVFFIVFFSHRVGLVPETGAGVWIAAPSTGGIASLRLLREGLVHRLAGSRLRRRAGHLPDAVIRKDLGGELRLRLLEAGARVGVDGAHLEMK